MACANSDASALYLPYGNVTVKANPPIEARGVALGVGSPPQYVAVHPSPTYQDTWIPNSATCSHSSTDLDCIYDEGGIYLPDKSSTYVFTPLSSFNGSGEVIGSFEYFNDDLRLDDSVLHSYPMIRRTVDDGPGIIGLGKASPWLDSLVQTGLISSKIWSMWYGSRSINDSADGSLIFGGYDANKLVDSTKFTMRDDCRFCARVTELNYITEEETFPLLENSFQINIDPSRFDLRLRHDAYKNFLNATDATYYSEYDSSGVPRSQFSPGYLSVTFSNGYTTKIPASEIWRPDIEVSEAGVPVASDSSPMLAQVSNDTSPDTTAGWGAPFLAMNYLLANPDAGFFELAPITSNSRKSSVAIHPICSTADGSDGSARSNGRSVDIGAVVGGTVGGVSVLVIILIVAFIMLRRHRKPDQVGGKLVEDSPWPQGGCLQTPEEVHPLHEKFDDGADKKIMYAPSPGWQERYEMPADFGRPQFWKAK